MGIIKLSRGENMGLDLIFYAGANGGEFIAFRLRLSLGVLYNFNWLGRFAGVTANQLW